MKKQLCAGNFIIAYCPASGVYPACKTPLTPASFPWSSSAESGQLQLPDRTPISIVLFIRRAFDSSPWTTSRRWVFLSSGGASRLRPDTQKTAYVAVVSQSFADQYWPHQDPIGQHFTFGFADRRVVGIAGNVRVRGVERQSEPQVYLPYDQVPDGYLVWYAPKDLATHSAIKPAQLIPLVRCAVAQADPQQPISDIQTLGQVVEQDIAPRLVQARVLGGFALVALVLAGIGIHGLLSFSVGARSQEIGLRIAVGAQVSDILGMVLRESLLLACVGVGIGLIGAYQAGHALSALLAGVPPGDLTVYEAGIGLVFAMTIAGSLPPALRAVRVDPLRALRSE